MKLNQIMLKEWHNYSEILRKPRSFDSKSSLLDHTLEHGFSLHLQDLSRGQGMEIDEVTHLYLDEVTWNGPVPQL